MLFGEIFEKVELIQLLLIDMFILAYKQMIALKDTFSRHDQDTIKKSHFKSLNYSMLTTARYILVLGVFAFFISSSN